MSTAQDAAAGAAALGRAMRDDEVSDATHDEPARVLTVVHGAEPTDLTKAQPWSLEQVQLVKTTICRAKDLSDDEARLFIAQCQRLGLDPILGQIYAVKRKGELTIQIGIDGYRKIADRTGLYAGNSDPKFEEEGGQPIKATVTVEKLVQGIAHPFRASARWSEYCPKDQRNRKFWDQMPFTMLGKCAEALALRKAFPAELGGFYIPEEMDQATTEGQEGARPANGAQRASQEPEKPSWAAARARGGADALEVPWGPDKGTPIGALSTEHLGRLLKWIRSSDRKPDFAANSSRLVLAIEEVCEERRRTGVDTETGEVIHGNMAGSRPIPPAATDGPGEPPPREPGEEPAE